MPKKLENSPDGVICSCCGQDKPAYHFYSPYGKTTNVTRFFFVNSAFSTTRCWECNGGYRCLYCGVVQDANQFRVGGRRCIGCKNAGISKMVAEKEMRRILNSEKDTRNTFSTLESDLQP